MGAPERACSGVIIGKTPIEVEVSLYTYTEDASGTVGLLRSGILGDGGRVAAGLGMSGGARVVDDVFDLTVMFQGGG